MRRLIATLAHRIDAFLRRCWLAWRYVRAMHYGPRVAWIKARRV